MEDTTSSEIVSLEVLEPFESLSDDEYEQRPIMQLLKRLIRNKQNTVMTNSQILEILKKEFSIDVTTVHELEVDIYIKIIKKYLKDWPQWEELERISSKLSSANDFEAVTKVLDNKYKKLKEYLGVMLEAAKTLTKKAVSEIGERDTTKETNIDTDVIMEIYCTRDQLSHLVNRKPCLEKNNQIFNIKNIEPTKITLNTLSLESIINFWWMKISINLPYFIFFRELIYKYKHTLVNKLLNEKPQIEQLDTRIFSRSRKTRNYSKSTIFGHFDKLLQVYKDDEYIHQLLEVLFNVFKTDIAEMPDVLKVPSSYRKYCNRYKYIRYLNVDNDGQNDKFDLCIEEQLVPHYQYFLGKLTKYPDVPLPPISDWLKFECALCKVKFQGSSVLMTVLQAHFNDYHQNESDWQCMHCKRLFSMDFLAKNKWNHEC